MAVDSVITQSDVGFDGNSYTTAVSNDKLTNEDFMKLLIEELKMQDPTKPMDAERMMDSQLKMSTIQANMDMSESMQTLQQSYANSALSTAASMIGKVIEDGSTDESGVLNSYKVSTVENLDGELYVNAKQMVGIADGLVDSETSEIAPYDQYGNIYEGDERTGYKLVLDGSGRFTYNEDGTIQMTDGDGEIVTDEDILGKYKYDGSEFVYDTALTKIPLSSVVQVR
jgi:flagellar basal-body rod modification protein FlgD